MPIVTISSPSYPFPQEIIEYIIRWCKDDPYVLATCSQVSFLWCQNALPRLYRNSWSYIRSFKESSERALRAQKLMSTLLLSLVNHNPGSRQRKFHRVFSRFVHQFDSHSHPRKPSRPLAIEYFCLVQDFDLSLIEKALRLVDNNIIKTARSTSRKGTESSLHWFLDTFKRKCRCIETFVATELPSLCLDETIPSLQNFHHLSYLELYSTDSSQPINGSHLALVTLACHQLQEIKIVNPARLSTWLRTITDEDISQVINSQKQNTLRKIHLEGLVMVPLKATLNSLKLRHLNSFRALTLRHCKLPERSRFSTLGGFPKFTHLEFVNCEELSDTMILGAAKCCTGLHTLDLSGCNLINFSTIAEFIQTSRFLIRKLAFKDIQYYTEEASLLLTKCNYLKRLTLGHNISTEQRMQAFISELLNCCPLIQLDLGHAEFDLVSAQQFYHYPRLSMLSTCLPSSI